MVMKPSAPLKVVTEPEPLPIGYAESPCCPCTNPTSRYSVRPRSEFTRMGSVAATLCRRSAGRPAKARITGARNSWNVKIAEVGNPGRMTTGLPSVTARQMGLPGLSATPWATTPGLRSAVHDAVGEIAGALGCAAGEHDRIGLQALFSARQRVFVVRNDAQMHGHTTKLLDRRTDDRGIGVVDSARTQRIARRDDFIARREDRDPRPPVDADRGKSQRREDADLAGGQVLSGAKHGFASGDVGARIAHVLPGR